MQPDAESEKEGDAAAAVAKMEKEEEAGRRSRANSDALAYSTHRSITVKLCTHSNTTRRLIRSVMKK